MRSGWLHANGDAGAWPATWYAEGLDLPPALPALEGEAEADLCVVGAGITGLSAALHAAQAGMRVVVLEAQRVGWGASGRNGGQAGRGLNWSQARLEARLGARTARGIWDLCDAAVRLTGDLAERHAPGAMQGSGIVSAAGDAREYDARAREAEALNARYGAGVEVLGPSDLSGMTGSTAHHGGLLDPQGKYLNPLAYSLGLARAARSAGAAIHERSEVTAIAEGVVSTAGARVRARRVLLAGNGYAAGLAARTASRVLPINNYIAVTAPLGERAPMKRRVAVADSRFVVNYFWQSRDGRLVYGGGESYGRRFPRDIRAKVRANLARTYPDLSDVDLTHAWGGTLAVTATRLPYVSEIADGFYAAGGYSGHGLALAGMAGKAVAEAARGDRARLDLLGALPVPALPGGRWLGPWAAQAGMLWGALRDRF